MPHNLYLHSSLVQSRKIERTKKGIKQALKFNFIDSAIALNLAFFVNAAILILAAAVFYKNGMYEVAEIQDAHALLEPLLGSSLAPAFFAIALIAAGQSSTLTGTLAGQIVMEGHLNLRIQPWVRRLITRMLAIIPALFTVIYFGESGTGKLLVLSQVVLSLQLGFAIIPLIHFVSSKKLMGEFSIKLPLQIAAWLITIVIVGLNAKLVFDEIAGWLTTVENPIYIWTLVVPIAIGAAVLLLYITFKNTSHTQKSEKRKMVPHILDAKVEELAQPLSYKKIAIPVDFSTSDEKSISAALQLGGRKAEYTLIHIVETPGAMIYGDEIDDYETESDEAFLNTYKQKMLEKGFKVSVELGFGSPKRQIPKIVNASDFDLLVLGGHGHSGFKDLLFGTTVDSVRHKVKIPVFIV
jgi:manganese transport protein